MNLENIINDLNGKVNKTDIDSALSTSSTNPVQNKVVKTALDGKAASTHTHPYAGSSTAGGAATSAVILQTTRNINGVGFNGSGNITVTANPTQNALSAEDLNTLLTNAEYYALGGNTCTNKPSGIDGFSLKVYRSAGGWYVQELTGSNLNTNITYKRQYNGSTWLSWQSNYSESNPQINITGNAATASACTGNSATATKLSAAKTIALTGDIKGSVATDLSSNPSIATTLANSGVTAGTYKSVTVDAKGRVTAGTNPTTLAGYGITDATPNSHIGSMGSAHGSATTSVAGFMSPDMVTKLNGIATGATNVTIDSVLSASSTNPLQNKVVNSALLGKLDNTLKGIANGLAELDSNGKVPASQLPSYVDDVLEYANFSSLPSTGETGKIYVTLDNNLTYRWTGSIYTEISASLALGETSATAYRGDRGAIAYNHSQATGNPHNLSLSNLGITSTAAEINYTDGVTSNIQTQLNNKSNLDHTHPYAGSSSAGGAATTALACTGNSATATTASSCTGNSATATKLSASKTIALTGDITGSVATDLSSNPSIATTLANSGVTAGTYKSVTVDAKGRVTAGTNPTTLAGYGITDAAPNSHVGSTGSAHGLATTSVAGFMSPDMVTKLSGITSTASTVLLYSTTSGSLVTSFTLSESIANFDYIEIIGITSGDGSAVSSGKLKVNGSTMKHNLVGVDFSEIGTPVIDNKYSQISINGTAVTLPYRGYFNINNGTTAIGSTASSSNFVAVQAIIGYKL